MNMKAMILAAGYGMRLRPYTEKIPKALVKINNTPLLELVIRKLINAGVAQIIINTHHLADQIKSFLKERKNFGISIELSFEPEILGTGGGLKIASRFLKNEEPFFLYNVDIVSTVVLQHFYRFHLTHQSIATLAVNHRKTTRYFLMDESGYICGHEDVSNNRLRLKRNPNGQLHRMGFCGIHVISPEIFNFMTRQGRFSIVDVYLDLIEAGLPVIGYPIDQFYWKDIGKLHTLNEIQSEIASGKLAFEELFR